MTLPIAARDLIGALHTKPEEKTALSEFVSRRLPRGLQIQPSSGGRLEKTQRSGEPLPISRAEAAAQAGQRKTALPSMTEAYGIPASSIAAICGVDIATARRWKRGTSRIPLAARKLLARDLGAFGTEWKGWTIQRGKIVSPEGWSYTPGEVLALTLLRAQVAHLQSEIRRFNRMDEQPLPDSAAGWKDAIAS